MIFRKLFDTFRKKPPIAYDMSDRIPRQKNPPPMPPVKPPKQDGTITMSLDEYEKLKEQSMCGCGICLAHNGWVCPKIGVD